MWSSVDHMVSRLLRLGVFQIIPAHQKAAK